VDASISVHPLLGGTITHGNRFPNSSKFAFRVAEYSAVGFLSVLAVTMMVAVLIRPTPSSPLLLVVGIAWLGSAFGILAVIAVWLLRSRGESGKPRPNLARFFFQAARVCLVVLALGAVVAIAIPGAGQAPLFAPGVLALLGLGFWGFFFCIMAYYYYGGQVKVRRLLLRIFTAATV